MVLPVDLAAVLAGEHLVPQNLGVQVLQLSEIMVVMELMRQQVAAAVRVP